MGKKKIKDRKEKEIKAIMLMMKDQEKEEKDAVLRAGTAYGRNHIQGSKVKEGAQERRVTGTEN